MKHLDLIEFCFENYSEIELEIEDVRAGINEEKVGRSPMPSSPTEAIALRNLMPVERVTVQGVMLRQPEKWLDMVDRTYSHYRGMTEYHLMKRRYEQGEIRQETCRALNISISLYRIMVHEILSFANGVANGLEIA